MSTTPVTPVAGYRPLDAEQLALMNENKLLEELVLRQVDRHVRETSQNIDQRFVSLARTHFQEGFMALNRSVARPQRLNPHNEALEKFWEDAEVLFDKLMRKA